MTESIKRLKILQRPLATPTLLADPGIPLRSIQATVLINVIPLIQERPLLPPTFSSSASCETPPLGVVAKEHY